MSDFIPPPTAADLARDAAADYGWLRSSLGGGWIRRANAAETDVKRLRGELVALSPLCEELRDAKERAEAAETKAAQLQARLDCVTETNPVGPAVEKYLGQQLAAERQRAEAAEAEIKRIQDVYVAGDHEVEQILGRVLGYPRYCDDQDNFPGALFEDGVCVGEHVPATLAAEAAAALATARTRIAELAEALSRVRRHLVDAHSDGRCEPFIKAALARSVGGDRGEG